MVFSLILHTLAQEELLAKHLTLKNVFDQNVSIEKCTRK